MKNASRDKQSGNIHVDDGSDVFIIRDCSLIAIGTGVKSQNLRELKSALQGIDADSIYYHFWGVRLRPGFDDPEYNNDFASWAWHGLHDLRLAERLSVVDPAEATSVEDLRQNILDIIEDRLDEQQLIPWSAKENQFHFIKGQLVVFNTQKQLNKPRDLLEAIRHMSIGSIYYHFVDARNRTENGVDDFRAWLGNFGSKAEPYIEALADIDPYFLPLNGMRKEIARRIEEVN